MWGQDTVSQKHLGGKFASKLVYFVEKELLNFVKVHPGPVFEVDVAIHIELLK